MTIKTTHHLAALEPEAVWAAMVHPAQRENVMRVAAFIQELRSCSAPVDFYELQDQILKALYRTQTLQDECSRVIKRLKKRGGSLPTDAPELPGIKDPHDVAAWEFETYVLNRVARQIRSVGDGLAWRMFGFERCLILTLSRSPASGRITRKEGLLYERRTVERLWKARQHFTLQHDLTNCLRIADLTEFTADGGALLHEVKKNGRTDSAQIARMQAAVDAVMSGGSLPNGSADARLVQLKTPYATNLSALNDLIQGAKYNGACGMKLLPGRALIAASVETASRKWGSDPYEGVRKLESAKRRAIERAGIVNATHNVFGKSADAVARSPIMPPWSIFPSAPEDCAALTCDTLMFETVLSPEAIAAEAEAVGMRAEVLLPHEDSEIQSDQEVMRLSVKDRSLTLRSGELSPLLYELVQPHTWAVGMLELLEMGAPPLEPVLAFAEEKRVWNV